MRASSASGNARRSMARPPFETIAPTCAGSIGGNDKFGAQALHRGHQIGRGIDQRSVEIEEDRVDVVTAQDHSGLRAQTR